MNLTKPAAGSIMEPDMERQIIHVDMDAFYAAIEQRDNPDLRGKPVVVGGDPQGRGVVSAASYEARRYGIHSAMPCAEARRRCPQAVFLPVNMRKYRQVSRQVMEILGAYTPLVEQISVDEAFMDVTGSRRLFGSAEQIARQIKRRIKQELGLTASVGVGPNKFIAKLASECQKPDGLVIVRADQVEEFLRDLPVSQLWGVGEATARRLQRLGISTVGQLAQLSPELLCEQFGATGKLLYDLAHGKDERPVAPRSTRKSCSAEMTFAEDTSNAALLRRTLLALSEDVGRRLRAANLQGRTITLKLRFSDFTTITRSTTLPEPVNGDEQIYQAAAAMMTRRLLHGKLVRLVGVRVSGFDSCAQLSLFGNEQSSSAAVDRTIDEIRRRFGKRSIQRGTLVEDDSGPPRRAKSSYPPAEAKKRNGGR